MVLQVKAASGSGKRGMLLAGSTAGAKDWRPQTVCPSQDCKRTRGPRGELEEQGTRPSIQEPWT